MTNEEIKNKLLSKSCEAELINQDGSKGQVLQVIPIGYIYSCFDEIEKLLTQTKKACYGEMREKVEDYFLEQGYIKERIELKTINPTHGNCCTCQSCGYAHEDCICEHNRNIQFLDQLNQMLNEKDKL